ncbi:membrane protein [Leisingera sp. ANG-M1]|nr:membrane protein [Leisingera sp. ANG-M1]
MDSRAFNWRRVTRHPALMEYRRLAFLVAAVNLAVFVIELRDGRWISGGAYVLSPIADMALINLSLGILIRQQRVVNALFWLATRVPVSWPLWIRWGAGKVFHFGGLHSGGTVAGTVWFGFLLFAMAANRMQGAALPSDLTLGLSTAMIALMVLMVISALGPIRARFHNTFEKIHRFAGWTVLALFWAQTVSLTRDTGGELLQTPAFWMLCLITLSIASPWLTLKRVDVEIVKPSNHAVLARFDYGDTPFPGSSNAISHTPFGEYHSFANIPAPDQTGYRLAISRAGDWTGRFIDNPPDKVWVKGITTSGVARIEVLFRKVVYVGTGSGIGPILPHLLAGDVPNRLIWSTRSPRATYGDALVDEIEAHTESPLIWDTDARGKPNLSALALQAVRDSGAEAVIVISNQKLTRQVVHDMESLGIPAYGAIWDS